MDSHHLPQVLRYAETRIASFIGNLKMSGVRLLVSTEPLTPVVLQQCVKNELVAIEV